MCQHIPVLLEDVLEWLGCRPDGTYVDCTLGLGGHARGVLRRIQPSGRLIAIDADADAIEEAGRRLGDWKETITYVQDSFRNLETILRRAGVERADGILFDLGMSSAQVGEASRGFSFSRSGPLDMRFDRRQSLTAADIVNDYPEQEIVKIIREFGEEPAARRIARSIVRERAKSVISSTDELAGLVAQAAGRQRSRIHPATRTFQALRIAVNREIESLEMALPQAIDALNPGGRLVVLSYQSLEDRIVKKTFRRFEKGCICPPSFPVCTCGKTSEIAILTKKPIRPSEAEIQRNPRSRSARMRVCQKRERKEDM